MASSWVPYNFEKNQRCFHSIAIEVDLCIGSSRKYRALRQNHNFFHTRPRWRYSHVFAVLSDYSEVALLGWLRIYGKSTAWFLFSPCQILVWIRSLERIQNADWKIHVNSKCGLKVLCEFEMQIERYMWIRNADWKLCLNSKCKVSGLKYTYVFEMYGRTSENVPWP